MGTFWAHLAPWYEIDENEGWHGVSVKTGVRGLPGNVMSVLKRGFCSQSKMHIFISIPIGVSYQKPRRVGSKSHSLRDICFHVL
jgi:hypothetical protein